MLLLIEELQVLSIVEYFLPLWVMDYLSFKEAYFLSFNLQLVLGHVILFDDLGDQFLMHVDLLRDGSERPLIVKGPVIGVLV